ncbi:TonB-dependent receptor [Aliikangiella coralliicola]|uniref:TonB-dependent receptor n=1 Tax=Aliikangiella coralliicola TaxID=2592383 RepID=A0A545U7M4_9GAMM|nr:TonB-dependent receptor [Aliikangiella coralliicola]TQV85403.1 TonB-dependent receptor [Aliikangiella coralliicola]
MAFIKNIRHSILIALAGSVFSITALANDEEDENYSDILDLSLKDLLSLKVTAASKFSQKISEASSVISVFKNEQIHQYGWTVINDVLYSQPGFGPSQDYDRPTVATRGNFDSWSNNHILHLVDGVPFNDNLYGSAYTWLMPLFTTNTLEVIRGPGSALYGSNATNGVVQMNTFNAEDLHGESFAKISFGDSNTRRVEVMSGINSGSYDFIMAFSTHETDGNSYLSFDGSDRLATLSDPVTGRPRSQQFFNRDKRRDSYLWAKLSINDNWNIQYHHQEWDFDTGHGWVFWIPDLDEEMNEYRNIMSVKYSGKISDQVSQEYVLRYQKHNITWNQRYYPNGAFENFYPTGMWEYLDTDAEDIFIRTQWTYFQPDSNVVWLAGIEGDRFSYDGDNEHFSNINIDSALAEPFPGNMNNPLGPWLHFIIDEPVINTAVYGQYTNNAFISDQLSLTLGVRWDRLSVHYQDINDNNIRKHRDFSRASPKFALVYVVDDTLSYKLLAGEAFRTPTPTEMAGAHTFSLASNIGELEPELLTTYELETNLSIDDNHLFRGNLFWTKFENQIAFSTVNFNLSTNVYSTENAGIELEFIGNSTNMSWFANISYTERLDETILAFFIDETDPDSVPIPEFTQHADDLKWEPGVKINAGLTYQVGKFDLALTTHYHGEVERRDNEIGNPGGVLPLGVTVPLNYNLDDHRPTTVDSWITFDLKTNYQINENINIGIHVKNLFEEKARLVKTGPFPFDYQINDRQVNFYLQSRF